MNRLFIVVLTFAIVMGGLSLSGCAGWTHTERGAAVGAAAGAAVGGAIGSRTGDTARGAIIGAMLGGTAGAIIGHQMDRQARELEEQLDDAHVERVGEGIAVTFESGILFPFDSDQILPAGRENLATLARSLRNNPDTDLLIVGHTDSIGDPAYNERLSVRRAESARNYLVGQGVSPNRVRIEGRGEYEPIASNQTAEGRQINRRVEVAIFASEEMQARAQREASGG
jgi:outer membrane protein OmpA-like peptidoglycan-associated protein